MAPDVEPVVRSLDHGGEDGSAEATAGEGVMDAHADARCVLAATVETVETTIGDDPAIQCHDKVEGAGCWAVQVLPDICKRLVWRPQRACTVAGQVDQRCDLLGVGGLHGANDDVSGR
jgi:hypothetical protein